MFINKKGKFTKQKEVERRQTAAVRTSVMNAKTEKNIVQIETDLVLDQDHASRFDSDDGDGSTACTRNLDKKGRFTKKKELDRRQMAAARMAVVNVKTGTDVLDDEVGLEHDTLLVSEVCKIQNPREHTQIINVCGA